MSIYIAHHHKNNACNAVIWITLFVAIVCLNHSLSNRFTNTTDLVVLYTFC